MVLALAVLDNMDLYFKAILNIIILTSCILKALQPFKDYQVTTIVDLVYLTLLKAKLILVLDFLLLL